jgi:hypothetical protein
MIKQVTLLICMWEVLSSNFGAEAIVLTHNCDFLQSVDAKIVPQIKPQTLPFTLFPNHYSHNIISFKNVNFSY